MPHPPSPGGTSSPPRARAYPSAALLPSRGRCTRFRSGLATPGVRGGLLWRDLYVSDGVVSTVPCTSSVAAVCRRELLSAVVFSRVALDTPQAYAGNPYAEYHAGRNNCGPEYHGVSSLLCNPWVDRVAAHSVVVLNTGAHAGFKGNTTITLAMFGDMMRAQRARPGSWRSSLSLHLTCFTGPQQLVIQGARDGQSYLHQQLKPTHRF